MPALSQNIKLQIESNLNKEIIKVKPLSGGDINDVYLIETETQKFVVKINSASDFPGMFEAEKQGLKTLNSTNAFVIPQVYSIGNFDDAAFLILEYIEPGNKAENFWEVFGRNLAKLHKNSYEKFGFHSSNYIGGLPQQNEWCNCGIDFYISQRLEPQLKEAQNNGYSFRNKDIFLKNIGEIIPEENPALVHGDLWNGNYLITKNGQPCLIDPSVAYSHREADIAMMHLFGGFDPKLFHSYNDIFPLKEGWKNRLDIWQLYYFLVHLNLFGSGYYNSVEKILRKYN